MQRFTEFLQLARRWPGNYVVRVASCRREYEAALMLGCSEAEIIDGTRYWLDTCIPQNTADFRPPAQHTFLQEQSFLAYQPPERKLEVVG